MEATEIVIVEEQAGLQENGLKETETPVLEAVKLIVFVVPETRLAATTTWPLCPCKRVVEAEPKEREKSKLPVWGIGGGTAAGGVVGVVEVEEVEEALMVKATIAVLVIPPPVPLTLIV